MNEWINGKEKRNEKDIVFFVYLQIADTEFRFGMKQDVSKKDISLCAYMKWIR